MGSLLEEQRDAGGLLYKRNRYYDPKTGQFTQSDPIGLGGGLNTYGSRLGTRFRIVIHTA
jgi:RHS repeat-associated protein